MGWVLLGCALCLALDDAASTYSVLDYRRHHGSLPVGAARRSPATGVGAGDRFAGPVDHALPRRRDPARPLAAAAGCLRNRLRRLARRCLRDRSGRDPLSPDPRRSDREPAAGGPRDRRLGVVERLPGRVLRRHPADRRRLARRASPRLPAGDRRAPRAAEVAPDRSGGGARRRGDHGDELQRVVRRARVRRDCLSDRPACSRSEWGSCATGSTTSTG